MLKNKYSIKLGNLVLVLAMVVIFSIAIQKNIVLSQERKQIEKRDLNNGKWELNNIVLDDLSRQDLRAIQPNSYLALDKIFNPYNVIIDEAGNYRIYIAFRDDSDQVISTEAESGNNL